MKKTTRQPALETHPPPPRLLRAGPAVAENGFHGFRLFSERIGAGRMRREVKAPRNSAQGGGEQLIEQTARGAAAVHQAARPLQRRIALLPSLQENAAAAGLPQRHHTDSVA